MKKQVLISIAVVFGLILLLGIVKFIQISRAIAQNASFAPPPEAVTTIIAKEEVWHDTITAVGSISPVEGVILSAEEAGKVVALHFESGSSVNKGDLLIELDTSVEVGNLKAARAREELARKNLERMQSLKTSQAVSKNEIDSAVARYEEARGEVISLEGIISKKKLTAPFSGTLGIRMVNVGEHVEPGQKLVPLYALDKIFVDFSVPQQVLAKVKENSEISFKSDVYPNETFTGHVSAMDPQIDPDTRNLRIQAIAENPAQKLRPGMFVKVDLKLGEKHSYISIPVSSVSFAPYGNSVYVVEKMKDQNAQEYVGVRQQIVEVGKRRGEQVAILKGLESGQEVVTSGVFKLRPGAAISVNNEFAPENKIDVNPPNT